MRARTFWSISNEGTAWTRVRLEEELILAASVMATARLRVEGPAWLVEAMGARRTERLSVFEVSGGGKRGTRGTHAGAKTSSSSTTSEKTSSSELLRTRAERQLRGSRGENDVERDS